MVEGPCLSCRLQSLTQHGTRGKPAFQGLFKRALIPCRRTQSHEQITSQKPHLPILSSRSLGFCGVLLPFIFCCTGPLLQHTSFLLLHSHFLQLWQAGATLLLGSMGCREYGLSSCVAWALLLPACGISVPGPGVQPMSPALAGRFFTTGPPGKSQALGF